ncbi:MULTISPECIES: gamma-glutamylcyclotransferase family protein [unclassified Frankia]
MSSAEAERAVPLFVYGTLLFPEVVRALIGRVPQAGPATVTGWRAARLRDRLYPGLVPTAEADGPDRATAGLVLLGLAPRERAILDAFEGEAYEARPLVLADGLPAMAYLWRDLAEAMPENWDARVFADRHLTDYALRCVTWRAGLADPAP